MNPSTSSAGGEDYSESPASPGVEVAEIAEPDDIQLIDDESHAQDAQHINLDAKLNEEDEEENRQSPDVSIRVEDGHDALVHIYSGPEWDNIYNAIEGIRTAFRQVAMLGDVSAVYRNRPIWTSHSFVDLVKPALDAHNLVPSSKSAVYNYTGLLIHEAAHQSFVKKEKPQCAVDYSTVELAAVELLKLIHRTFMEAKTETVPLEILQWICDFSSELSQKNTGRPCISGRGPEFLLELFRSSPPIEKLISLLDLIIDNLLSRCPEACMKVLFEASRSGSHFIWIWLHIAATFPGQIVDHLFTIGSEQFKTYVENVKKQTKAMVPLTTLETLHEDYRIKFVSLSDVFNFLMNRQNMELKNLASRMIRTSLEQEPKNEVFEDLNFAFFFKLVTCSVNTLRFLVMQNSELVTVLNVYWGTRQLLSLDKRLLLSNMQHFDFLIQIIHALDSRSLALALNAIVHIAFDPHVFQGIDDQPSMGHIQMIKSGAYRALDPIVTLMMRTVHNSDGISQANYEPIGEFARGKDLQLLIDAVNIEQQWSPVIIRYLHVLSCAYGELKAAEISLRFLISIKEPAVLTVLMAFLKAITPYYPSALETMYANFSGLLNLIENDFNNNGRSVSTLQLLSNLCLMQDWEMSCDAAGPLKYFRIFPAEHLDELFTTLFARILKEIHQNYEDDNRAGSDGLILTANRLLVALSLGVTKSTNMAQRRYIHLPMRSIVKVFVQLAGYLRLVLLNISPDRSNSLPLMDDTMVAVSSFISFEALSPALQSYVQIFIESYISSCLQSNEELFGETVNLNCFEANSGIRNGQEKDDDNLSLLDTLSELSKKTRLIDLKNSGVLPRKRKLDRDNIPVEAHLRAIAFVKSVGQICKAQQPRQRLRMSRHAAGALLNALCHDGIELDLLFHDWDTEKELIAKHLKVVKRLESSRVCQGLCDVLSHFSSFAYCIPLLKSLLAVTINQLEVSPSSIPTQCLSRLDLFCLLSQRCSFLPSSFFSLAHLVHLLSNPAHAHLVLLEVWKFYQELNLTVSVIDAHVAALESGQRAELIPSSKAPKMEWIRWVIQADIGRLAPMFPKFFPTELSQLASEVAEIASP